MKAINLIATFHALKTLQRQRGFFWDAKSAQYVSKWNNRPVREQTVLNKINRFVEKDVINNIGSITEKFIDGKMTISVWQKKMATELKDGWAIAQSIGRGGRKQMTQSDWGRLGGRLRFEYQQLNRFAAQIKEDRLTDGQIRMRANFYARSVRTGYFDGLTAAQVASDAITEERRILQPAEHCIDCVGYAARGWVPAGTLPEPGVASQCMRNCKCFKEFRASPMPSLSDTTFLFIADRPSRERYGDG